eukprot:27692-Chlamydomonas_euryale.AAC.1
MTALAEHTWYRAENRIVQALIRTAKAAATARQSRGWRRPSAGAATPSGRPTARSSACATCTRRANQCWCAG